MNIEIVLKDGTHLKGRLWEWNPTEGYISIICDTNPQTFSFEHILAGIADSGTDEKVDLLKQAQISGWRPR